MNITSIYIRQSLENSLDSWSVIENGSINEKVSWLLNTIKNSTNQFQSVKVIKTNDNFFDQELENMRRKKNELYKIAQCSSGSVDSATKWHEYRKFKNEYKNKIQIKRYECNQRKLDRVQGDIKGTRKVLNSILCKESCDITRIKMGCVEYNDDQEIANEFNKYFINSIVEINESIPHYAFENVMLPNQNLSFQFHCVSITDLKCCLKELKNNTDEYFLNPKVLIDAMFVIGQQLVTTINDSFVEGVFPEASKSV